MNIYYYFFFDWILLTDGGVQNSPLFIKTFVPDTGLKFHYIVHSSLDVIEERGE